MTRILFGIFLLVHALIHLAWVTPPPPATPGGPAYPFDLTRSPLLPGLAERPLRVIGVTLVSVAVVAFVAAGLGVLGAPGLSAVVPVTVSVGAVASLLVIALFWNTWFVVGALLDVALLAGAYFGKLPG